MLAIRTANNAARANHKDADFLSIRHSQELLLDQIHQPCRIVQPELRHIHLERLIGGEGDEFFAGAEQLASLFRAADFDFGGRARACSPRSG